MLLKTSSYSLFISNPGIINIFFIFPMLASSDSIWFSELRGAILLLMAAPPAKLQGTCFTKVHRSIDCCFSSSFCPDSTPRLLFLMAEELFFLVPCNLVEKLELLFLDNKGYTINNYLLYLSSLLPTLSCLIVVSLLCPRKRHPNMMNSHLSANTM